ncbi:DUF4272 domain-containing protein [Aliikangiella marina]|uniref:DUF4272 domain-containing protein n=1 Tax=Aliikangiella marina TaxID=1712262 RepID=A0A545TD94_9GAMM|nr:DUF4272 domain-containing protein [Aliikangiella marina]TQV75192.1 DUF4272 domain-containing protein [Aliikangiella marina]
MDPQKIKEQNIKYLQRSGIKVIDWLPHINISEFRCDRDVAIRSVILAALLQLHFGAPNDFIEDYLKRNRLYTALTKKEKRLLTLGLDEWPNQDRIDLEWSIEAIWSLQWAGGKHNNLTFNTFVEDSLASMLPDFARNETADEFIKSFTLLDKEKIFTELDKFYRAHWYARNVQLKNNRDDRVNLSIIMERRKALEWICDKSLDWDDVPLDT